MYVHINHHSSRVSRAVSKYRIHGILLTLHGMYGTHQLQLKRDTRGTRKGHACYTRVFLVIYTQLHAM